MMGQNTLSASLQVTPNWEEWLISGRSFRGILAGWRNKLTCSVNMKALLVTGKSPHTAVRAGASWSESSFAQGQPGGQQLAHESAGRPCGNTGYQTLGCMSKSLPSRLKKIIISLHL